MAGFNNPFASFRMPNVLGGGKRFTTGTVPSWSQNMSPAPRTFHEPGSLEALIGEASPEPNMSMGRPDARMAEFPGAEDGKSQAEKYYDEMERVRMGGRGPALTAYQKALGEQPTYDQYKPSKGRRIGAALIGAGSALDERTSLGEAAGMGLAFKETPYRRAQEEYGERMKGLGASAKLEQDEIEAKLKSLQAARALGLDYDEYELKRLESDRDFEISKGNLEVNQGNLDVNRFTADTGRRSQVQTGEIGRTNAATNRMQAGTQATNVADQIQDRAQQREIDRERIAASLDIAAIRASGRTPPNPREQQDAIDGAARQLVLDPQTAKYIEGKGTAAEPYQLKQNDGTRGWRNANNKLIEITNRQLIRGLPFGDTTPAGPIEMEPGDPGAEW